MNLVRFRNIGKKFEFKRKKADFTFVTSDEFRCIGLQHFDRSIITGVEPHNIIRTVRPKCEAVENRLEIDPNHTSYSREHLTVTPV